ncbi:hypothetical protein [Domibacillus iocasae]|uniref:Spore coat protein CotO n=1 Tax=Domibacillus iocasae TaxID=1714016 RepID=A0A1E7DLN5_9BACI|nr:hypothetical protein [Domibacillus iocasae]OES43915.1 hypothetical protein BA724_12555 [Domibacillus iocasae]
MKKPTGPLLYIGQPHFQPVKPVMQEVAKAGAIEPQPTEEVKQEAEKTDSASAPGRLKPFREMGTTEKVIYLAKRRIPVPCRFDWSDSSVRGTIEKFDGAHVWVLDEESHETVQVPIAEIVHIRLAGT